MAEHKQVFVFGSNREGRHGMGAALRAVETWGAKYGQPEGRQGNSYAIVTKELRRGVHRVTLTEITDGIHRFLAYVDDHPEIEFLVSRLGSGLAGYSWEREIRPMFAGAQANVVLLEDRRV